MTGIVREHSYGTVQVTTKVAVEFAGNAEISTPVVRLVNGIEAAGQPAPPDPTQVTGTLVQTKPPLGVSVSVVGVAAEGPRLVMVTV